MKAGAFHCYWTTADRAMFLIRQIHHKNNFSLLKHAFMKCARQVSCKKEITISLCWSAQLGLRDHLGDAARCLGSGYFRIDVSVREQPEDSAQSHVSNRACLIPGQISSCHLWIVISRSEFQNSANSWLHVLRSENESDFSSPQPSWWITESLSGVGASRSIQFFSYNKIVVY